MSLILISGAPPPPLVPYCQRCDMPVERYRMDLIQSTDHIGIHAACCGQESSTRITLAVYLEMVATGKKLYCIVRKGSRAGLRGRGVSASSLRSVH